MWLLGGYYCEPQENLGSDADVGGGDESSLSTSLPSYLGWHGRIESAEKGALGGVRSNSHVS